MVNKLQIEDKIYPNEKRIYTNLEKELIPNSILYVEDDPMIRKIAGLVFKKIFPEFSSNIFFASDYDSAYQIISNRKNNIEILCVDGNLGNKVGYGWDLAICHYQVNPNGKRIYIGIADLPFDFPQKIIFNDVISGEKTTSKLVDTIKKYL